MKQLEESRHSFRWCKVYTRDGTSSNLLDGDLIRIPHFIGREGPKPDQSIGIDCNTQPPQFPLT